MAVNITEEQAQEMRDDPNYKDRTQSCPLCDPSVHVEPGISVLHVCQCGNVWQPMQVLSANPTCIIPNGAVSPDKLLEAFGQKETTPESEQLAALADKWERERATKAEHLQRRQYDAASRSYAPHYPPPKGTSQTPRYGSDGPVSSYDNMDYKRKTTTPTPMASCGTQSLR